MNCLQASACRDHDLYPIKSDWLQNSWALWNRGMYSLLQHTPGPASCLSVPVSLLKTCCPVCWAFTKSGKFWNSFGGGTWVLGFLLLQTCCIYTVSPSPGRMWLRETALLPQPQGTKASEPVWGQLFCFSQLLVVLGYRKCDTPQGLKGFSLPKSTVFRRLQLTYWWASGVIVAKVAIFFFFF